MLFVDHLGWSHPEHMSPIVEVEQVWDTENHLRLMVLFHCVVRLGSARLVTAARLLTARLSSGRFVFPLQFSTARVGRIIHVSL